MPKLLRQIIHFSVIGAMMADPIVAQGLAAPLGSNHVIGSVEWRDKFRQQAVVPAVVNLLTSFNRQDHIKEIEWLSCWQPTIQSLRSHGWTDTHIAGLLGGFEELFFSGILVGAGSTLLTHLTGISYFNALLITSTVSGILFPLMHMNERYRLNGGVLTSAPPESKARDMVVLTILGGVLRLIYANTFSAAIPSALPFVVIAHTLYNATLAPRMQLSLGLAAGEHPPSETLLPLQPNEIAVTRHGLEKHFLGNRLNDVRPLKEILEVASHGQNQAEVDGITYFRRRFNGQIFWVFADSQKDLIGMQNGWQIREHELTKPQDDEVSVVNGELSSVYVGHADLYVKLLNDALKTASGTEEFIAGVKFRRRQGPKVPVWTFKRSDVPAVAKHYGWDVRELEEELKVDEVAVTEAGFSKEFIGNAQKLANEIRLELDALTKQGKLAVVNGIDFRRRVNRSRHVWAMASTDVQSLAKNRTWQLRKAAAAVPAMQEDEVPVTAPGITTVFLAPRNSGSALGEELDRSAQESAEVTLANVRFSKRRLNERIVWTFKRADSATLAGAKGWTVRPDNSRVADIRDGDIPLSNTTAREHFVNFKSSRLKEVIAELNQTSAGQEEFELGGIQFRKRKYLNWSAWTVPIEQLPGFATHFGLTLRTIDRNKTEFVRTDEIPVTDYAFSRIFVGMPSRLTAVLRSELDSIAAKLTSIEHNGITFIRRLSTTRYVWAFKKSDLEQLARQRGWILRADEGQIEELNSDESAVSRRSFSELFSGTSRGDAAQELDETLTKMGEKSMQMEYAGIKFTRRTRSGHRVWAFSNLDLDGVGKLLNLKPRLDSNVLIENLGLEDAIALLGDDPLRLKQYVQLYHPELAHEDVDAIAVTGSMRGLRGDGQVADEPHAGYRQTMEAPFIRVLDMPDLSTKAHAYKIEGRTEPGIRTIQVIGAYTRKIVVRQDGTFSATLPIPKTGEANHYIFYAFNSNTKEMSDESEVTVHQTGVKEDTEAAFLRLLALKEEVLESIKVNPSRYYFLLHSLEQSLLRQFTYSEDQGFAYMQERIRQERSHALKELLSAVKEEFLDIATTPLKVKSGQRLYFFQKYTIYKVHQMLNEPDPVTGQKAQGVIIANEQGLGKTVTALVIINGKEAVIITPNGVVSTWGEQEEKFMTEPRIELLEGSYAERQAALPLISRPQVVTNVEYTQGMTDERAEALSQKARMLVVDEADYLGRLASQQSKGTRMIQATFRLLLTATPFKKVSHIGNMLGFLYPNDPRFGSSRAFARAFPADDPQTLNALFLLMQRHTVRIRKKDVFEEYDPSKPLSEQSDRLPKKAEVDPSQMGRFALTTEQADSIKQLFTDYQAWCRAHKAWIDQFQSAATQEDRKYKRFKEGFFPKLQALRQIMNDPAYLGRPEIESPKHQQMDQIVHHELDGNQDHKVIIFCKYIAEVESYLERYKEYGAIGYYGELPKDSNGYKIDDEGNREYYQVDEFENFVLKNGKPILATKATGKPIRVLDYQRLLYQNDPQSRILVATYDTGSVGVTLTGAHAVIDDDLAPTYRDQYQADDRAHRIDNDRKKYEVRYYRLQAMYPQDWLNHLDPEIRHDYFDMGTYDQVQSDNLKIQSRIFHRIMDGVGDESELVAIRSRFLAKRMPFLFKGSDAEDTEEAIKPETIEGQDAEVQAEESAEHDTDFEAKPLGPHSDRLRHAA